LTACSEDLPHRAGSDGVVARGDGGVTSDLPFKPGDGAEEQWPPTDGKVGGEQGQPATDGAATGSVKLKWVAPAAGATLSGTTTFQLSGQGFLNVEIFRNGTLLVRCTVSASHASATASVDTTQLPDGALTLTAHAWDSAPGQTFTSDADAGPLTVTVKNGAPSTGDCASGKAALGIEDMQLTYGYPQNPGLIDTDYANMAKHLPTVKWIRIDLQDNDATQRANFVHQLQKAHANGYKVLALVGPTAGDFDGSTSFPYPLHLMNTTKAAARLTSYLNAASQAGQTIEAFELGNELDSCGFNGDMCNVNASSLTAAQKAAWQEGLARLYSMGLDTIRTSAFASAKVITTGMTNAGSYSPGSMMSNPYAALKWMESYNGVNYLAAQLNGHPGFDGYGGHLYAWANGTSNTYVQKSTEVFTELKNAGLSITRPLWITEFGLQWQTFSCSGSQCTSDLAWQGGCASPNTCGGGLINGHSRGWYTKAWIEWMNANAPSFGQSVAVAFVYDWADWGRVAGYPGYSIFPCDSLGAGTNECADLSAYTCK